MSIYSLYRSILRPVIFSLDAETAHNTTIKMGKIMESMPKSLVAQTVAPKPVTVMGLNFSNPLGLAAGMDKNGDIIDYLGSLGFGFIEVGTVTPLPQDGNPKPRMFRIVEANGIINRMGFNNKGVDYLVKNLVNRKYKGIVGVSIGKNEVTPIEDAHKDYITCMKKVYQHCDYIAVNVSCPNTPNLTALQEQEPLNNLLSLLKQEQFRLADNTGKYVPLVVKIAPDLNDTAIEAVCKACLQNHIDGMTCTNTTTSRDTVYGLRHAGEWGGLSGKPLYDLANKIQKKVYNIIGDEIPLIGVGGVNDVITAREKLKNGAKLIQIYSGFVYEGPKVIKDIVDNL